MVSWGVWSKKGHLQNWFRWVMSYQKGDDILKNTAYEQSRIEYIIGNNLHATFGIDISHYQNKNAIHWEDLTIGDAEIPLDFVVIRATMGANAQDYNYQYFRKKAVHHHKIVGAYHFFRPNESAEKQAKNFIRHSKLRSGDIVPILDVELLPRYQSKKEFVSNVKLWMNMVEAHYGVKPILYTYYYFYRDYLRADFSDYPLWLANYNRVEEPSSSDDWLMWQFTENGIVKGSKTKLDVNIFNGSIADMRSIIIQ